MTVRATTAAILLVGLGMSRLQGADSDALQFVDSEKQLGELRGDQDVPVTFLLTNRSDKAVKIVSADTSCHCTWVLKAPAEIPAHGSGAVDLNFNSARADGDVSQTLFVETADGQLLTGQLYASVTHQANPANPAAQASDEFDGKTLGLQWQWNAAPRDDWASFSARPGFLRLASVPAPRTRQDGTLAGKSLYGAPNFLLQQFPAPEFTVTTALQFAPAAEGEFAGLTVVGLDYARLGLQRTADGLRLVYVMNAGADRGAEEREVAGVETPNSLVYLRVTVGSGAMCQFAYSFDNQKFTSVGEPFMASGDRWIGAKIGLIASASATATKTGYADFEWFRVTP